MPLITTNKSNSIINPTGTNTPTILPTISIDEAKVKSVFVDTQWTPKAHLLTHIEGSSWTVEYYSQAITPDSALSGQQYTVSSIYQQYRRIHKLEMKVSSPLSTSQNDETKEMEVQGNSILYPFLVPNEGDMFIADIGQGREAIFRITGTTKRSIFNEACYEINYILDNDDADKIVALRAKAIEDNFFHKEKLTVGSTPLVKKKEHDAVLQLEKHYAFMLHRYFTKFYSKEYSTLIIPDQQYTIYDSFLTEFVLATLDSTAHYNYIHTKKLQTNEDEYLKADNLLTALLHRDVGRFNYAFTKTGLVSITSFLKNPTLNGLFYSGARYVVYPRDFTLYNNTAKSLSDINLVDSNNPLSNNVLLSDLNTREITDISAVGIYPIDNNTGYILSNNFYQRTNNLSNLEDLCWKYLEYETLDIEQLLDTTGRFDQWSSLSQFYYAPIVMLLIKNRLSD